ncbi:MAG: heavy metal translocating P-type ATPase [Sulfuriferula sp.]
MNTLEIGIEGMTCASCVAHVEKALRELPGVLEATVNLATERAQVRYDPGAVVPQRMADAISEVGYTPVVSEMEFAVEGMTCASCVAHVEKAVRDLPGVTDATVNLATERVQVHYFSASVDFADFAAAVEEAGYQARPLGDLGEDEAAAKQRSLTTQRRGVWLAAALTLPVVILSMGMYVFPAWDTLLAVASPFPRFWDWVQAALTTAVLFGPGLRFFRPGFIAYRRLAPDMNSLVSTGTGAAWLYSMLVLLVPNLFPATARHVYFDSAAVVIVAVLLGKYMESLAKGRGSAAIQKLMGLQAKAARIQRSDGTEESVPLASVRHGDLVVIRPGEQLAVDGIVREGVSHVDQAMLTGEPVAVKRQVGDAVVGGTINQEGRLLVEATSVGKDAVLGKIIQLVERAQTGKLPIQRLADRAVRVFTPIVLAIALLSFLLWLAFGPAPAITTALISAVAVLVVACPCAMGLATPAAIMVGTGRAAEMGVLFRKGEALESLSHVDTVLFDKTGTLTEGRPALVDLLADAPQEALRLAASLESNSEHPLALAVLAAAQAQGVVAELVADFSAVPGFGIQGVVNGRRVLLGARRFVEREGIDIGHWAAQAQSLEAEGKTVVFLAADQQPLALLAIADPIKPDAAAVVAAMKAFGLKVAMVTGDGQLTAESVARALGIDEVHAEVLPADKAGVVTTLQQAGQRVAFVGDGINDAPALAQADVGIALASGTDIAIEAADVTLTRGELGGVPTALVTARKTMSNIRGNLFWAFFYNILLIPVAAGVLIPFYGIYLNPMLAGVAMGTSSIFVLGNSMRLKWLQPWKTADQRSGQAMVSLSRKTVQ